jgi:hypothetical protein
MKKSLIAVALIGLALTSCKKDYSCTCTSSGVSYYDSDFDGVDEAHPYSYTSNIKIEEANKTQAAAACNEATIKEQDGMSTSESTCTLSK